MSGTAAAALTAERRQALGRRSRTSPASALRLAVAASFAAHAAVAVALAVNWPRRLRQPNEVEAKIEMIFGRNAIANGAPAPAAGTASAAAQPGPAPAAVASSMLHAGAAGEGTVGVASPPVRLGDGIVGFDVPQPDPGIVEAQADPGNRPPLYPEAASRRHEHGSVVLRIHVGTDGRVASIEMLHSSGYPDLDYAARDAARRWRFIPQLRDGEPVASVRDQNFDFVLE